MTSGTWIGSDGEPRRFYRRLEAIRARPGLYLGDCEESAALKCLGLVLEAFSEIARLSAPRGTPDNRSVVSANRDGNGFSVELRWNAYVSDPCPDLDCVDASQAFPQTDPDGRIGSKLAIVNALSTRFALTAALCGYAVKLTGEAGEQTAREVTEIPRDGRHSLRCEYRLNGDIVNLRGLSDDLVTGYVLRFSHERPGLVYLKEADFAKRGFND